MRKTILALTVGVIGTGGALAAPQDYRLDVTAAAGGRQAIVKLVHAPTGKVVDNADIFVREQISPPKGGVSFRDSELRRDAEGRYIIAAGSGPSQLWAAVRGTGDVVRQTVVLK